ncbi:hypothetical protein OIP01_003823 [Escherichia coli]|nr:hypothetical protein [Escherichia coli]EIZ5659651.1 hypothetical protein [Escherichia coli]EJD2666141.1 hypothetical protein [Escherichia coli]EJZ6863102.1 hypothetical protein [Escherichia coli]EKN2361765.1 hypothetical protein [Escherichia coli]
MESVVDALKAMGKATSVELAARLQVSREEVLNELLMDYAELRGGSAADAEAWRDDYEAGKTPVEAYCDEWGEDDED